MDVRIDYKKSEMTDIYFEVMNVYARKNVSDYEYSDDYTSREEVSDLPTMFSFGVKMTF